MNITINNKNIKLYFGLKFIVSFAYNENIIDEEIDIETIKLFIIGKLNSKDITILPSILYSASYEYDNLNQDMFLNYIDEIKNYDDLFSSLNKNINDQFLSISDISKYDDNNNNNLETIIPEYKGTVQEQYRSLILYAITNFNIQDIKYIERMSITEYQLRLESCKLQDSNKELLIVKQAFYNQAVKSTDGNENNPQMKYQKLEDLYDYNTINHDIYKMFNDKYSDRYYQGKNITKSQSQYDDMLETFKRHEEYIKMKKEKKK